MQGQGHKNPTHLKEAYTTIVSFWNKSPLVLLLLRAMFETNIVDVVSILDKRSMLVDKEQLNSNFTPFTSTGLTLGIC